MPNLVRPNGSSPSGGREVRKVTSGVNSLGREGAAEREDEEESREPVVVPRPIAPTKALMSTFRYT